jgi:hypothetical protein
MTVFTHAEKNQIEDRLAFGIKRGDARDFGLRLGGRFWGKELASDAMDLIFGDVQGAEEKLLSEGEIAFGISRRDAALVAPEEVNRSEA